MASVPAMKKAGDTESGILGSLLVDADCVLRPLSVLIDPNNNSLLDASQKYRQHNTGYAASSFRRPSIPRGKTTSQMLDSTP